MLIFADSFDHYSIVGKKWTNQRGSPTAALDTAAGRFGTTGWYANSRYLVKQLGANYPTLIVGVAYKPNSTGWGDDEAILNFKDAGSQQCELRYNMTSGLWSVQRAGSTVASATSLISLASFHYIEFKATIHNSAGVAAVRVNGVEIINATGLDTQNTANAYINELRIGSATDDYRDACFDDLYLLETAGGGLVDFLGDVRIECIRPTGNGASSQWVGSDGNSVDNYALVDETTPNDDTDYVESQIVADKDTYAFGNLATVSGTVYAVQILPYARKTDAGARSIKSIARLSGGTEEDGTERALLTTYQYFADIRETKPGGGAWSIADVNGAEFGVKVTT